LYEVRSGPAALFQHLLSVVPGKLGKREYLRLDSVAVVLNFIEVFSGIAGAI
jgi:hypothetical protein